MSDIKVFLKDGSNLFGQCYCVDKTSKTLVLKIGLNYKVIMGDQIIKIEGSTEANTNACVKNPALLGTSMNLEGLAKREQVAYEQAGKNIAAINTKVDSNAQLLFEKLLLLFPCKWVNESIMVLDTFCIDPPYDTVVQKAGVAGDSAGMAQVTRTLLGIRRKHNIQ